MRSLNDHNDCVDCRVKPIWAYVVTKIIKQSLMNIVLELRMRCNTLHVGGNLQNNDCVKSNFTWNKELSSLKDESNASLKVSVGN